MALSMLQTLRDIYAVPRPYTSDDFEYLVSLVRNSGRGMCSTQTMHSFQSSTIKSTADTPRVASSTRRSVTVMKHLLPLKLSSSLSGHFETSRSTRPSRRGTFGLPPASSGETLVSPTNKQPFEIPEYASQVSIQPAKYRDTPIYTEPGSPVLSLAYYANEDAKEDSVSHREPSRLSSHATYIINDYEISDRPDSDSEEEYFDADEDCHQPAEQPEFLDYRGSDLSFGCQGESQWEKSMCMDEAAWLSSPLNPWNSRGAEHLPEILAQEIRGIDIEGWISDSTSSRASRSRDDLYAYATALPKGKAQVVEVNKNPGLSIMIPPRSSSLPLLGSRPQTPNYGRESRMGFRDSYSYISDTSSQEGDTTPKQRRSKTPVRPLTRREGRFRDIPSPPEDLPPIPIPNMAASYQSTLDEETYAENMITALEKSTRDFPSSMLLPSTPCMSSLRLHCRQRYSLAPSRPQSQLHSIEPPTPPPSPFAPSPDWLQNPFQPYFSSTPNDRRRTSCTSAPSPRSCRNPSSSTDKIYPLFSTPSPAHKSTSTSSALFSSLPQNTTLTTNLRPLRRIFPHTSDFLRSALYAHIIGYSYTTSLANFSPHPSSLLHASSSSPNINIPFKAADTFGIPSGAVITPAPRTPDEDFVTIRIRHLEERLRGCIARLVTAMEGSGASRYEDKGIDVRFLRSLVEVVKGCEERGS